MMPWGSRKRSKRDLVTGFVMKFTATSSGLTRNPTVPRLRPGGYRRVNLKTFRHYLTYVQIGETIWILAIAHGHRKPEYWIKRKQDLSQPDDGGNSR